jgi:hypothetical protein
MITSDLSAPLPQRRIQTVEEALDLGFKILVQDDPFWLKWLTMHPNNAEIFHNNSHDARMWTMERLSIKSNLLSTLWNIQQPSTGNMSNRPLYDKIFSRLEFKFSENYSIHTEFNQCSKSLFMGSHVDIMKFLTGFKQPSDGMYLGVDKLLDHSRGFVMSPMQWDRQGLIHRQFQSIIHSGVFHFLRTKQENKLQNLVAKNSQTIKALNMKTSLMFATFGLLAILILTTTFVFIFEFSVGKKSSRAISVRPSVLVINPLPVDNNDAMQADCKQTTLDS